MNSEFDIQYEQENKLSHTIIDDIYFYNDDEGKYYKAKLTLFGHCSQTTTYDYLGRALQGIKTITNRDSEIEVSILLQNGDDVYILIGDARYCMNNDKLQIVMEFYNNLNKSFIDARLQFRDNVLNEANKLKQLQIIDTLFTNYIEDISPYFFINYKLISGIELLIEKENPIGKLLFKSSPQLRQSLVTTTTKKENGTTLCHEHIENYDVLNDYMENHLSLLIQLISKKFGYDKTLATYLTHELISIYTIKYFSNLWRSEFGEYFLDINSTSLSDAVLKYCCIDSIDPNNLINTGKLIYFLMDCDKSQGKDNYLDNYDIVVDEITSAMENKKLLLFEKNLIQGKKKNRFSMEVVDLMNGYEFENFVSLLFSKMGYKCEVTKSSGDQGVDVIANKNEVKIGIQAKCYSNKVSNSAIQEVIAGMKYYNCDKGMVITNNYFTTSASEIAQVHNITLWNRDMLKIKLDEIFQE